MNVLNNINITPKELTIVRELSKLNWLDNPRDCEASGNFTFDPFGNLNGIFMSYNGKPTVCIIYEHGDLDFHTHPAVDYDNSHPSLGDLQSAMTVYWPMNVGNPKLLLGPQKIISYNLKEEYLESQKIILSEMKLCNDENSYNAIKNKYFNTTYFSYSEPLIIKNICIQWPAYNVIIDLLVQNVKAKRLPTSKFIPLRNLKINNEEMRKYIIEDNNTVEMFEEKVKLIKANTRSLL